MAMAGLYKRNLPSPPAIDFASPHGKVLFRESIQTGTMEGFFKLIAYFQTQSEPAYCGLASLAMVLNALAIDPCRKWKGPWRWFDESMLDCCEPLEEIIVKGISFGKVVCLAHCAGARVEAFRTSQSTLDEFRKYVIACASSDDCHVIASYHRGAFKQTGSGHFSPIGGYHAESDMALILDVARFKYPPHWVPLSLLWEAMDTVDKATGLRRGFMLVSRRHQGPALLYSLSCKHESWIATAKYMMDDVPVLLTSDNVKDIRDVLSAVIFSLPPAFAEFLTWVAELQSDEKRQSPSPSPSQEENQRRAVKEEVLRLVQETNLYSLVTDTLFLEDFNRSIERFMGLGESLPDATDSVSSPKVESIKFDSSDLCHEGSVRCSRASSDHGTMGSLKLVNASSNVLTTLLLALPPQTWSCIKDEKVLEEVLSLVCIEGLPKVLQDEILYLRGQLLLFKRCKDCCEDPLDAPPLI